MKHYGKEGLKLLTNLIHKVGDVPFNQYANQLRGEGIMRSRSILPDNFNVPRLREILVMIENNPKLRRMAGKRKKGAIRTLGTLALSTLVPIVFNTILPIIQKTLFK